MKRKALVVALLCFMGLATLFVGNAMAVPATYTCTISQVGANYWGSYIVVLSDTAATPAFTNTTFYIVDPGTGLNKSVYAAALTAWANSSRVQVYVDLTNSACFMVLAVN